jgi:hypothetical protein
METVLVAEGCDALHGVQLALCVLFFKIIRVVSHRKIVPAIALQVNDKKACFVKKLFGGETNFFSESP